MLLIGGLFVLGNLGVNVTSLVAGLGLGGLAIALAAQDTIRNLLGRHDLRGSAFQVGDWVVLNNIEGTVEHVGFRSSRVRTFYNSVVTVPNARIVDTHVDNMGLRRWRRYKTTLGFPTTRQRHRCRPSWRACAHSSVRIRRCARTTTS